MSSRVACRVPLATCHVPCRRYRWFFDSPRGEEDRFDSDRFVLSVSEEHQEFVKELRLTQAFSVFVQERTEILPSLAFMNTFDRCLDDPTHAKWLTRSNVAAIPLQVTVPSLDWQAVCKGQVVHMDGSGSANDVASLITKCDAPLRVRRRLQVAHTHVLAFVSVQVGRCLGAGRWRKQS